MTSGRSLPWRSRMSTARTHPDAPPLGPVLGALAENWWLLLLRGTVATAFRVIAFLWPRSTLFTLVFLWGVYAVADGIFALWAGIAGARHDEGSRWWLAVIG